MGWSDRQRAMLREMGIRLWPAEAAVPGSRIDTMPESESPASDGVAASAARPEARLVEMPAAVPTSSRDAERGPGAAVDGPPLDWAALREAVAGCTACNLCQGRQQTVFGVGNEQAHWMIVGEAPGEQEDRQGEPFVGKSGQLLDNMLRALGLGRGTAEPAHQVYIANAVKCRPPGNRNPQPDELACCEPFLARQVQLVRPRIILAMGRFAVQSLLRSSEPIGRLRGRVHTYLGVPLIVTYHPAYLLRNPLDKARAWDDLCLALETLTGISNPSLAKSIS